MFGWDRSEKQWERASASRRPGSAPRATALMNHRRWPVIEDAKFGPPESLAASLASLASLSPFRGPGRRLPRQHVGHLGIPHVSSTAVSSRSRFLERQHSWHPWHPRSPRTLFLFSLAQLGCGACRTSVASLEPGSGRVCCVPPGHLWSLWHP